MSDYGYIDSPLVGSLQGLDNQVEGGWAASEVAGIEFGVPVFAAIGDSVNLEAYVADSGQVNVGISIRTQNAPGLYEQYDAVNVLTHGKCIATCSTACNANDVVYVAADGSLANAGEAINARFRGTLSAAGTVEVEFFGPTTLATA